MFASSISSALTVMRTAAEELMIDTVHIERPSAGQVLDEQTGKLVPTPPTLVYDGKGRIQVSSNAQPNVSVGGGEAFVVRYPSLQIPVSAPNPQPGDRVSVVTAGLDPLMVGSEYVVGAVDRKTHAVMQRIVLKEAT